MDMEEEKDKRASTLCGGRALCIFAITVILAGIFFLVATTDYYNAFFTGAASSAGFFNLTDYKRKRNVTHIVYFLADDFGWNDVGYHGSPVQTPNLDKLASEGVKLEKFYVNAICTPSRSALMSGRYVTHTGLQHLQIESWQLNALGTEHKTFPELLRTYGYKNYMVGKWHLGFYKKDFTPTGRGFDKFMGIYTGDADHITGKRGGQFTRVENGKPYPDNTTYETHLFAKKATEYVEGHLKEHPDTPMFLFVSFQAVHAPLQVPTFYSDRYKNAKLNPKRKLLAGMATAMDEAIKNITDVFKTHGIWDDTVTFFSTDNGGYAPFGSDNSPLSGGKATCFEGGIRGVAFARGKGITPGRVSHDLIHITDIFPTFVHLAQTDAPRNRTSEQYLETIDGVNVWDTISNGSASPRKEILVNIDPLTPRWGRSLYPDVYDTGLRSAIIVDNWKLITGFAYWPFSQQYYPPAKYIDGQLNTTKNVKLYDLDKDPYEKRDLFFEKPEIVQKLIHRLRYHYNSTVKPHYPNNWCTKCYQTFKNLTYVVPYM